MLAGRHKGAARPDRRRRFEELALPHTDALYGAALRLVHNARDAEDLVQDALLRAYQSFDDFDGDGKCKAWLFRILMNAFVNKYRRRVLEQQGDEPGHLRGRRAGAVAPRAPGHRWAAAT